MSQGGTPHNQKPWPGVGWDRDKRREVALKKVQSEQDLVQRPAHYTSGKIEVIDFIEDQGLDKNHRLACVVKYVARCDKKHTELSKQIQDLRKAEWYLRREIVRRIGQRND
jgi:hypothetical protein